nr:hypothetical protein GCM10020093_079420 [Planobispora longispora]
MILAPGLPPSRARGLQSLGEAGLVLGVEVGDGLVQHQDRRVHDQGAGDRDPGALAAGEGDAALPDDRVQSVGELPGPICASRSASSTGAPGAPRRTFSAREPANRCTSWGTTVTSRRRSASASSLSGIPPTVIRPWSGSQYRSSSETQVDLPAPDGPTSATVRPGRTVNDTPRRTSGPSGV